MSEGYGSRYDAKAERKAERATMTDVDARARECAEKIEKWIPYEEMRPSQIEKLKARFATTIAAALRSRDAEWKAEISRLTELPDDVRSCGELSCDDCNARTAQLRAEVERLREYNERLVGALKPIWKRDTTAKECSRCSRVFSVAVPTGEATP